MPRASEVYHYEMILNLYNKGQTTMATMQQVTNGVNKLIDAGEITKGDTVKVTVPLTHKPLGDCVKVNDAWRMEVDGNGTN